MLYLRTCVPAQLMVQNVLNPCAVWLAVRATLCSTGSAVDVLHLQCSEHA